MAECRREEFAPNLGVSKLHPVRRVRLPIDALGLLCARVAEYLWPTRFPKHPNRPPTNRMERPTYPHFARTVLFPQADGFVVEVSTLKGGTPTDQAFSLTKREKTLENRMKLNGIT